MGDVSGTVTFNGGTAQAFTLVGTNSDGFLLQPLTEPSSSDTFVARYRP